MIKCFSVILCLGLCFVVSCNLVGSTPGYQWMKENAPSSKFTNPSCEMRELDCLEIGVVRCKSRQFRLTSSNEDYKTCPAEIEAYCAAIKIRCLNE